MDGTQFNITVYLYILDEVPRVSFRRFFQSQIKTFNRTVLRTRHQQIRFNTVKCNFVNSPPVVVEHMILFISGRPIQVPCNYGTSSRSRC